MRSRRSFFKAIAAFAVVAGFAPRIAFSARICPKNDFDEFFHHRFETIACGVRGASLYDFLMEQGKHESVRREWQSEFQEIWPKLHANIQSAPALKGVFQI